MGSQGSLRAGHEGRGVLRWDPFSWSGELGSGECGLLGAPKPGPGPSEGQGRGQQMPQHAALARAVPPMPASAHPRRGSWLSESSVLGREMPTDHL